jgi:hypothetical protein
LMITKHVFTRDNVSLSLRDIRRARVFQDTYHRWWYLDIFHGTDGTQFCYQTDYDGCRAAFDAVTAYMQEVTP